MSEQEPFERWDSQEKGEKAEKEQEKGQEKQPEKAEKSWDEKWRRDPVYALGWALIFIWAGVVLLAENLGYLEGIEKLDAWDLILVGAGVVVLLQAAIRLLVPSYRRPITGTVILAFLLIALGLGGLLPTGVVWAAALILVGLFVLLRAIIR
jgi:hypothetical protein